MALLAGRDLASVVELHPEIRDVFAEPDLAARLTKLATVHTAIMRRTARLLRAVQGAAGGDPSVARLLSDIDHERRDAMDVHARAAAETGQLTVDQQECRDVLLATTDGSLWLNLAHRAGWSDARYAAWLARLWTATLVDPHPITPA